jgi:hypothetical protein
VCSRSSHHFGHLCYCTSIRICSLSWCLVLDSREVVAMVSDPWILHSRDLSNVRVLDSKEVVAMVSNPWVLHSRDLSNVY